MAFTGRSMEIVFRERLDKVIHNSKCFTLLSKEEYFALIDEIKAAQNITVTKTMRQYNLMKK